MSSTWSLRRRLRVVLFSLLAIFAIAAAVAITTVIVRRGLINDRRANLEPANTAVDELVAAAIDQETGERGYVITGDEKFLAPYESGRRQADAALAVLDRKVDDSDVRRTVATTRDRLAAWRREAAAPEIAAVRAGDRAEAARHVATGIGRQRFDEFRAAAGDLEREVNAEITSSTNRLDDLRGILNTVAIGGLVLATALILLVLMLTERWVRRPLARLTDDVSRVAQGRLDTPITAQGPPEIADLARDVEAMRTKLLADLAGAVRTNLLDVQQSERQRLAADLHDDPIQVLTVAVMRLDLLKANVDDPATAEKIDEARTAVRDAIDRLRTMLFELAPPALDRHGIARALDDYTSELFAGTDTSVHVDSTLAPLVLSSGVRSLAFRVAREAIVNARKHAQPTALRIEIDSAHGGVRVVVHDDGRGFDVAAGANGRHRGLEFGANLVRSAGGWWTIESEPGDGTRVEFWLPDAALVTAPEPAPEPAAG